MAETRSADHTLYPVSRSCHVKSPLPDDFKWRKLFGLRLVISKASAYSRSFLNKLHLVILLPACLSVRLSDYWYTCMYVCLSVGLSAILFVRLSSCSILPLMSPCFPVCLHACLSFSVLLSPSTSSLCLPLHSLPPCHSPPFLLSHSPPPSLIHI